MADFDQDRLAPGLLVAVPQMADDNFDHSVVYLISHDDDGAFGLVLNRPSEFDLADVCQEFDIQSKRTDPVFAGGPVETNRGFLLHSGQPIPDQSEEVEEGVQISGRPDVLEQFCKGEDMFRLFVGYSGWGPGQLEAEISVGAWLTLPSRTDYVFSEQPETLWTRVLDDAGIHPGTIATPDAGTVN